MSVELKMRTKKRHFCSTKSFIIVSLISPCISSSNSFRLNAEVVLKCSVLTKISISRFVLLSMKFRLRHERSEQEKATNELVWIMDIN